MKQLLRVSRVLLFAMLLIPLAGCKRTVGDIPSELSPSPEFLNDNPEALQARCNYEITDFRWSLTAPSQSTFFSDPVVGETFEYDLISSWELAFIDSTVSLSYFTDDALLLAEIVPQNAFSIDSRSHRSFTLTHTENFKWQAGQFYRLDCHLQYTPPPFFDFIRMNVFFAVIIMVGLLIYFFQKIKKNPEAIFVRRIPGIDAIEEAVGRATEMGRPVLYVPGIDDITEIQTIASMLILGKVAETVARYKTPILVPCRIPFVMTVAEEMVRQAYYNVGMPEDHRPENISFISDEQFAYTAGVNGIMLREKPAANLMIGRFFAESLILSETGFQSGAIQVAGTAEVTQLPFFIAACDYTLIGEEMFAASAYLSRDAKLLSNLKATDYYKILIVGVILVGSLLATFGVDWFSRMLIIH